MQKNIIAICGVAAVSLVAQPQVRIVTSEASGDRPMTVDFIGHAASSFNSKSVKGLPYSAEAVNESTQVLADGNRISRKSSSNVYRDSQGRTRSELSMPDVGPWASGKMEKMVTIFDPVAKTVIMLHPDKTATRNAMPAIEGMNWSESSVGPARTMIFTSRVGGPQGGMRIEDAERKKEFRVVEDVIIERAPAVDRDLERSAKLQAETAFTRAKPANMNQSMRKESLGKKVIEGVEAEGTRVVSTIAAGEIGNERAIEIVDETWYSKELEALVYSRHADPQTGETSYKLVNVQRIEQPITLFEVPADYKMIESGPPTRVRKPANE